MFTVKRFVPAVAALAVLLTACGDTNGDVTTTNDPAAGDEGPATQPPATGSPAPQTPPPTPTPEPTEPDPSPRPDESVEPEGTPAPPPDDDSGDSGSADEPATELTVRLDPGTGGEVQEWTVTCDPSGGTIGNPDAACATLDSLAPRDVRPVPRDANCTMVYGGPQTAAISGRWDGTKVDLSFSRQNGCEIARWNEMDPVLPASDGGEL